MDSKLVLQLMGPHLSTCTAVMSPPCLGELGGTSHTHGDPLVRDPNWGFGSQGSTLTTIHLNISGGKRSYQSLLVQC